MTKPQLIGPELGDALLDAFGLHDLLVLRIGGVDADQWVYYNSTPYRRQ